MHEIPFHHALPFPILSALVLLPLVIAACVTNLKDVRRIYAIGIGGGALELLLSIVVLARFERHTSALQFVEDIPLFGGLEYHLGVDGISVLFLPLTALLALLVTLYAQGVAKERPGRYIAAISLLQATLMGAFVA